MRDVNGDALLEMLHSVAASMKVGEKSDIAAEIRRLPVVLRAALGAVALTAADRPLNGVTLATAASFSRGTAYRHNREAINLLVDLAPALVDSMLVNPEKGESLTVLNANLRQRDQTVAELRERLRASENEREMALAYARDLFETVSSEIREIASERARKVRPLRVVESLDE